MSNYEEEIISQNVVNLISEEKLQEMEASGTVPPNQEFLTPDDIEDIAVDCIRTEVVYDNRSANKHWDYKDGIPSGTTVTGKDFSKYVKLIVHTYQAGTIGGVRGSCEVDLTQPSLQWDGSKQTYYAGSNVYYCTYVDDGSDDYVQSRTCMALVDSTKTSITVYSTKTGKYHQQANDGKIFMIEGVLKTPAMIYSGSELHEGEGISIKDGVISSKGSLLVAEITAVGTETDLIFRNLDINADGGIYDFEISSPTNSPNIRMKASNDGGFVSFGVGGNWNGAAAMTTSQRSAGGVLVANVYNGCMLVTGTIKQHSNYKASVIAISESGNTSGPSDVRCLVTCGYFNISSNITSITFTAESNTYYGAAFAPGQTIKIYKRATNPPTRPQ